MALTDEARQSLERIQHFDPESLSRHRDLGETFNFSAAVASAGRIVRLWTQLSPETLGDFPDNHLTVIRDHANAEYNRFKQILDFDPATEQQPSQKRDQLIQQVQGAYNGTFNQIFPYISYGASKSLDFRRMETEARAAIQAVEDNATAVTKELSKSKEDAQSILEDVRRVATEQGVTQQAIYFKDEADSHETQAKEWRKQTITLAWVLGAYAIVSLWFHQIPGLDPETPMRAVQLTTSKILIFGVIAYMLFLATKNFLSHRHNAVVNRHRQNALMTFKALADAAEGDEAKDIVLAHAAACIFAPQETGYSKSGSGQSTKSIIELIPKAFGKADG